ncbi:hypothetical protein D3C79_732870 [compost metagenome]
MAESPSTTEVVPLMLTVVVSMVSVTWVTAGCLLIARSSKLPPVAPVMVALTLPASMYTSSAGAGTLAVPVVLPASMVMVAPLLRVTVTVVCALLLKVAV